MTKLGTKYIVKDEDTLWDLAGRFLGDPAKWPFIYEHNNNAKVIALTGTKIANPDLIFVGQIVYIPKLSGIEDTSPGQPVVPRIGAKPPPGHTGLAGKGKTKASKKLRSIPFKYNLQDLPSQTVMSITYIATTKLSGSITIQSEKTFDFVTVSQDSFEISAKREADLILGKLVSETKVGWNPTTNQISFENGITLNLSNRYAPSVSVSMGISSKTQLPVAKAIIKYQTIKGRINFHAYVVKDFALEIEITPLPPSAKPKPLPFAKPRPVPAQKPSVWDYLVASALIAVSTVVVVATIAEDVVTFGAGTVDDPVSFAAASAMFMVGVDLFKTVPGSVPIPIEGAGKHPPQL